MGTLLRNFTTRGDHIDKIITQEKQNIYCVYKRIWTRVIKSLRPGQNMENTLTFNVIGVIR